MAGGAMAAERPRLKDAYKDDFIVGAAIGENQILGGEPKSLELVAEQFNAISPENCLKWESVHPEADRYDFEQADKYVEFGEKHGMFILGHTLVWHNQTPDWVFEDENGKPISRDALLARMRDHIHTVVGRYKGRIDAWDVVNEAVNEDGTMRQTKWLEIIGPDYLAKAYEYAHEADPDAELYYNDYNEWKQPMRDATVKLIRDLKQGGAKIDGIGMQGHWGLDYPTIDEAEASIAAFANAAGKVMITEIDINNLPSAWEHRQADLEADAALRKKLDPYANGLPDAEQAKLANRYREVFALFQKHADKIDRVTFWGVHDGQSWLNDFPVRGRTAYPLLFDRDLRSKPAFDVVIEVAQ
jgi:endo-1,4-beta-xylanase